MPSYKSDATYSQYSKSKIVDAFYFELPQECEVSALVQANKNQAFIYRIHHWSWSTAQWEVALAEWSPEYNKVISTRLDWYNFVGEKKFDIKFPSLKEAMQQITKFELYNQALIFGEYGTYGLVFWDNDSWRFNYLKNPNWKWVPWRE